MSRARIEQIAFRVVPVAVLGLAFAGICVMVGSAWPWQAVVHEDGSRTLLDTVLYFEHAARELLPDLVVAMAAAGAVRGFFPPDHRNHAAALATKRRRMTVIAMATLLAILGGTIVVNGGQALADNLSQSHTRAGAPLVWGAHWRYHFLDRLGQILAAFGAAGLVWLWRGRPPVPRGTGRWRLYLAAFTLFAIATIIFRVTAEPFRDPAFLGHQLRELFTHGLVTLPLALGTCLGLARRFSTASGSDAPAPLWSIAVAAAGTAAVAAFLLIASLAVDAQSHGQTTGLGPLLLPHFGEHAFGYVFVPALAGLLYSMPARGTR
jgi:hypothetical protein